MESAPEWIGALSTFGLLSVAWFQLRNLVRSNTIRLVLDLEAELNARKARLDETSSRLRGSLPERDWRSEYRV